MSVTDLYALLAGLSWLPTLTLIQIGLLIVVVLYLRAIYKSVKI